MPLKIFNILIHFLKLIPYHKILPSTLENCSVPLLHEILVKRHNSKSVSWQFLHVSMVFHEAQFLDHCNIRKQSLNLKTQLEEFVVTVFAVIIQTFPWCTKRHSLWPLLFSINVNDGIHSTDTTKFSCVNDTVILFYGDNWNIVHTTVETTLSGCWM